MSEATARLTDALAGRYTILSELGQGGMATVYLAEDVRHHRKVAMKVLHPELSAVLGTDRFLKEIELTANLQHPHILPLFDSGSADGLLFYVMPYIEGETLRGRLERDHQLPVGEAVRIATDVAEALEYAHKRGVIHRDIKPENILLQDGRPLVADFGIALAVQQAGGDRMTQTGLSLGTPQYMSPEQAMGERTITARSDVYTLGCVLYEMLTGEPPFTGPTSQAIVARVITDEPRSIRNQRKSVPPHVEAAVQTALCKLPADRFGTAAQFAEALGKTDFTAAMTHEATGEARGSSRKRTIMSAAPWAVAAVVAAVGAMGWLRADTEPVRWQKILIWDHPVEPGGMSRAMAVSPDGETIIFSDTAGGKSQLWIKQHDRLDATALTGSEGASGPVFSPDGKWIAFVQDGKLKKLPRLGGSPVTLADSAQGAFPSVSWLDDGTILFASARFDLDAVSQDGGAVRRILNIDSIGKGVADISGVRGVRAALVVMCTWGCPDSELWTVRIDSRETRVLTEKVFKSWHTRGGELVFARPDGQVFFAGFDAGKLAFSSEPVPVLQGVRTGPAAGIDMHLTPGGTAFYAIGSAAGAGQYEAVWMSRDGTMTPVDSGWTFMPTIGEWGMAVSPDGRRLAISIRNGQSDDIWIRDLVRGDLTRLTFEGNRTRPAWTVDGTSVMYLESTNPGNPNVWMRRADGTGSESMIVDLRRPIFEMVPTANASELLVRLTGGRDIGLARVGDTTWTPLLAAPQYEETAPTLSPDGRWLAYVSDETGRAEVVVRPYPDVNGGRWQVSRAGGTEPAWSSNGRELYYLDPQRRLISAAVETGNNFLLGAQRPLFSVVGTVRSPAHRYYEVLPDGRFLFARFSAQQQEPTTLGVVKAENWLREVSSQKARSR